MTGEGAFECKCSAAGPEPVQEARGLLGGVAVVGFGAAVEGAGGFVHGGGAAEGSGPGRRWRDSATADAEARAKVGA